MSEEVQETNDGTWSGLRKTIIGTLGTVVAGGGTWLGVTLFGGGHDEPAEETKTEQPAAQPVINLNVQQNQENKQKVENGGGNDEPTEETKTEQPAAQPVINLNVQQNQENKQKTENNNGGGVVRERIIERPAQQPASQPEKPKKVEEESW